MNKNVIFTCITGNYEKILPPTYIQDDFDYVCFTDNVEQEVEVWQLKPIPTELKRLDKIRQQRLIKILAHKYLPEYETSIYVDGSIDIINNLDEFVETYCNDEEKSVFIRKHPLRDCIYDEAAEVIRLKKDVETEVNPQMFRYESDGYPKHNGLAETGIIYRKHNDEYCKRLMECWADEIIKGSHRCQLSFNYALWKIGDEGFKYIENLDLMDNKYFKWYDKHNREK